MINTKQSKRRELRFNSLDELSADLNRIEAAERSGRLRTTGNWTAGQILTHVAAWIDYGYEGYPVKAPPFFVRWLLRLFLGYAIRSGLRPGVQIPGVPGGTTGARLVETQVGIDELRRAVARLAASETPKFDSPAFGKMSMDQRIAFNLRHAELHLSFIAID